ncbi:MULTISPECIES: hypothetical protein [Bradyrhizobium]|uniref:Uncharacterized protein n=1 Tax=Bradyrhizobium elkanii TaxID=29448 RepID=A0A8I1YHS5_BRAEL|nr:MULTISPECIES: hypothetical protein [Bradyrhizobium]MBP1299742.1 hypothetical protein [Bradyrhizobium elkanii]MCS3519201.1 hypothetical protein [Bradyrhizobium elkanii]MCS4066860.1 hypothetical protein [Bradyrhizobium elkanii]MCS4082391.1 hypothetical protein [Bradyrhizobium elkanii]MCW2128028.1 hypothetical protein [Bradyrhizobium elkanii]
MSFGSSRTIATPIDLSLAPFVGVDDRAFGDPGLDESGGLPLGTEHGRDRIAAAPADGDVALAVLVTGKAAVNAILLRLAGFT